MHGNTDLGKSGIFDTEQKPSRIASAIFVSTWNNTELMFLEKQLYGRTR
jgi:hypothetical protein